MDFQKEKDVFFSSTFQNICLAFLTGCIILFWSFWFSFFCRLSNRMYFSYSGHPAFVGLLFKTLSVRGKPFHFLSALTLAFWEGSPCSFCLVILQLSHECEQKLHGFPKGCIFLILANLLVVVYFSKHFPFKANHFIFCWL